MLIVGLYSLCRVIESNLRLKTEKTHHGKPSIQKSHQQALISWPHCTSVHQRGPFSLTFMFLLFSLRIERDNMEPTPFIDLLGQSLVRRKNDLNTNTSGKRGSNWEHILQGDKYGFQSMEQVVIHSLYETPIKKYLFQRKNCSQCIHDHYGMSKKNVSHGLTPSGMINSKGKDIKKPKAIPQCPGAPQETHLGSVEAYTCVPREGSGMVDTCSSQVCGLKQGQQKSNLRICPGS